MRIEVVGRVESEFEVEFRVVKVVWQEGVEVVGGDIVEMEFNVLAVENEVGLKVLVGGRVEVKLKVLIGGVVSEIRVQFEILEVVGKVKIEVEWVSEV